MADYIPISDAQIEPKAPVTSELMNQLRDNPIAIAEGAVGAPTIGGAIAVLTPGDVGTDVFAIVDFDADITIAFGSSVAGSNLTPAGFRLTARTFSGVVGGYEFTLGSAVTANYTAPGTLSGTWVCLGYAYTDNDSSNTDYAATKFRRIL